MNLDAAHDLMDLLLDKAEQPYFTDNEKNQFLDHAIMSFINFHYSFYDQEQVSRDALMYFTDNLDDFSSDSELGFGVNLPENYVHLIHFRISYGNASNPSQGVFKSAKIIGTKDFWDLELSSDPFNKPTETSPYCYVRDQVGTPPRIYVRPHTTLGSVANNFAFVDAVCIVFRDHNDCFSDDNNNTVREIYQREIIDIAVRKMTGNIESPNIQYQQIEAEQSKSI